MKGEEDLIKRKRALLAASTVILKEGRNFLHY